MINLSSYICCGCGERYGNDKAEYIYKKSCICKKCSAKLKRTDRSQRFFGRFLEDHTYSPFYYEDLYRDIFLKFKFSNSPAFGHLLGMAAADSFLHKSELSVYDCIVPVPLSKEKYNERGYNQSEILARYMAAALGIELKEYLIRIKHCPAQSTLTGIDRIRNVIGAFKAMPEAEGKKIIVFDDVHTTGSTINECGRTLLEAGAAEVCFMTAAYVYHDPERRIHY